MVANIMISMMTSMITNTVRFIDSKYDKIVCGRLGSVVPSFLGNLGAFGDVFGAFWGPLGAFWRRVPEILSACARNFKCVCPKLYRVRVPEILSACARNCARYFTFYF